MSTIAFRAHRILVITLVMSLCLGVATTRAEQDDDRPLRVYESRFLGAETALRLVFQICGRDEHACEIERLDEHGFTVRTREDIHDQIARLLAERDLPPATQEFRVILLRASREGSMPELPAGATAAIADLMSVMPFTGFELVDSALVRTSEYAETHLGEMGTFGVELQFQGDPRRDAELLISFELRVAPVLQVETPAEGRPDAEAPVVRFGDSRRLINSSFGIRVGETVVVGTSRLNGGDEALVALLTALER